MQILTMIAFHKNKSRELSPVPAFYCRALLWALGIGFFSFAGAPTVTATTFTVQVAPGGDLVFSPFSVSIQPGDTVTWVWKASGHSVTSGTPAIPTTLFNSGIKNVGFTFSFTFPDSGTFSYFCQPHGVCCNMIGRVVVAGSTPPSGKPLNLSTRVDVETGDNVAIGGFFVTGGVAPKTVAIRAVGPSLANATPPVAGSLADPVLDLHKPDGTIITNNDWKDNDSTSQGIITANGLNMYNGAVIDDKEAIIVAALSPNATAGYTAVLRGQNNVTGIGLVEVYDLDDPTLPAQLANISTRGLVGTDANVLIGGVIVGPAGSTDATLVVRAIGPSLGNASPPVANALADPVLELHNGSGDLVTMNDNWQDGSDAAEIEADGLAPADTKESALLATLPTGNYTAIVLGQSSTTGVALVEVYRLP